MNEYAIGIEGRNEARKRPFVLFWGPKKTPINYNNKL
jgi:hypothetical protein